MAAFQRILHLIVLSGLVLPGLSLSPSVNPIWSPPLPTKLQKQSQDFSSRNSGKAEMEDLDLDGGTADDNGNGGYTGQAMPVEPIDGGYRHPVEGSKGQRFVEGRWGGKDATTWDQPAEDESMELLRQGKSNGETGSREKLEKRRWNGNKMSSCNHRVESDKEKRKWGENSMRVWGKRGGSGTEKRKWGDNSMSVWGKRAEDGNEKRKWGDNSMSVWGKRSDNDKMTSDRATTSGRTNTAVGADSEGQQVTQLPGLGKQKDVNPVTGSSQSHRTLSKRSILNDERNLFGKPKYDWVVEKLSKKSRPPGNTRGNQYDGPKRNWETNTMKVWGKRGLVVETIPNWDEYLESEALQDGQRSRASGNANGVWGKGNSRLAPNDFWKDLIDSYESS